MSEEQSLQNAVFQQSLEDAVFKTVDADPRVNRSAESLYAIASYVQARVAGSPDPMNPAVHKRVLDELAGSEAAARYFRPGPPGSLEAIAATYKANRPQGGYGLTRLPDGEQRVVSAPTGPATPPQPTTAERVSAYMAADRGFGLRPIG